MSRDIDQAELVFVIDPDANQRGDVLDALAMLLIDMIEQKPLSDEERPP